MPPREHSETPDEDGAPGPGRFAVVRELRRLVRDLLLLVVVGSLCAAFLFQPFKVEGASMRPGLADHERILVNKLVYHLRPVQRGDVVVFWFPGDPERSFIKRVIGLPGDRVEMHSGEVFVNGRPLEEPYVQAPGPPRRPAGELPALLVKDEHYFVLGDHRTVSNDSRAWGLVPEEMILGKAMLRYWPPHRIGRVH